MMRYLTLTACVIGAMALASIVPAVAQDAPAPVRKCGGLLCDAGMFDHQNAFGDNDCGVFCRLAGGGPAADAAAAAQRAQAAEAAQTAAAPPPMTPHHKVKRKHMTKTEPIAAPEPKAN